MKLSKREKLIKIINNTKNYDFSDLLHRVDINNLYYFINICDKTNNKLIDWIITNQQKKYYLIGIKIIKKYYYLLEDLNKINYDSSFKFIIQDNSIYLSKKMNITNMIKYYYDDSFYEIIMLHNYIYKYYYNIERRTRMVEQYGYYEYKPNNDMKQIIYDVEMFEKHVMPLSMKNCNIIFLYCYYSNFKQNIVSGLIIYINRFYDKTNTFVNNLINLNGIFIKHKLNFMIRNIDFVNKIILIYGKY